MSRTDQPEALLDVPAPAGGAGRADGSGQAAAPSEGRGEARQTRPVAAVLVDSGLAHLDHEFEYAVPDDLDEAARPGVRVKVRFAGQDRPGYLVERRVEAVHEGRLAPLRTVVSDEPVLTPHVLQTARRVAAEQAGTVQDVLRLAIPPRHARAERALPREPATEVGETEESVVATEAETAEVRGAEESAAAAQAKESEAAERSATVGDDPVPPVWQDYRAGAAWWRRVRAGESPRAAWLAAPSRPPERDWPRALAEAARAAEESGRGAVIVVPDLRDVSRVDAALTEVLGADRHVRLTADQGPQARYTAWLKALRGHVRVVVGTRAAAYAPVPDLGLVAWWDDGDDLHQEPRSPYPHVRQVLTARADLAGAALLVGGLTMSTDTAALVGAGRLPVIGGTPPRREAPRVVVAGEGIDEERDGPGARAHIPSSAWRAAREALQHGPVLLQVPRRGYLPAMSCASCRAPARCQHCHGPLALPGPDRAPECRWCARSPSGFVCPHCEGTRLRAGVVGARRTAEEIGRAFPGVPVLTSGGDRVREQVGSDPAIVVATPGAEPVADGGYRAVLLLDAWALLDRPDLRAAEEAVRRWFAAAALARSWTDGGVVVLAGAPGHVTLPPVEALVRWDPQWFVGRELAERAELGLPPTSWSAQVRTTRGRCRQIVEIVDRAGGEALGPLPVPGDDEHAILVVRADFDRGPALARALHDLRAGESARKERDLTAVRVGARDAIG